MECGVVAVLPGSEAQAVNTLDTDLHWRGVAPGKSANSETIIAGEHPDVESSQVPKKSQKMCDIEHIFCVKRIGE